MSNPLYRFDEGDSVDVLDFPIDPYGSDEPVDLPRATAPLFIQQSSEPEAPVWASYEPDASSQTDLVDFTPARLPAPPLELLEEITFGQSPPGSPDQSIPAGIVYTVHDPRASFYNVDPGMQLSLAGDAQISANTPVTAALRGMGIPEKRMGHFVRRHDDITMAPASLFFGNRVDSAAVVEKVENELQLPSANKLQFQGHLLWYVLRVCETYRVASDIGNARMIDYDIQENVPYKAAIVQSITVRKSEFTDTSKAKATQLIDNGKELIQAWAKSELPAGARVTAMSDEPLAFTEAAGGLLYYAKAVGEVRSARVTEFTVLGSEICDGPIQIFHGLLGDYAFTGVQPHDGGFAYAPTFKAAFPIPGRAAGNRGPARLAVYSVLPANLFVKTVDRLVANNSPVPEWDSVHWRFSDWAMTTVPVYANYMRRLKGSPASMSPTPIGYMCMMPPMAAWKIASVGKGLMRQHAVDWLLCGVLDALYDTSSAIPLKQRLVRLEDVLKAATVRPESNVAIPARLATPLANAFGMNARPVYSAPHPNSSNPKFFANIARHIEVSMWDTEHARQLRAVAPNLALRSRTPPQFGNDAAITMENIAFMTIRLLLGNEQMSIGSAWANELAYIIEAWSAPRASALAAAGAAIRAITAGTAALSARGKADIETLIRQYNNDARQPTNMEPDPPDVSPPLTLAELRDSGMIV